ncbi:hypothetical protein NPIL_307731 [Nephila pilipes]|uniref:Uncharacterized protein n=1 Tax=Nephila pilipes TaxID=299642 RepID=A0A8X6PV80_NEPPI|nr:hypothetical protein NPIL_307731 [Nephila pilipes]
MQAPRVTGKTSPNPSEEPFPHESDGQIIRGAHKRSPLNIKARLPHSTTSSQTFPWRGWRQATKHLNNNPWWQRLAQNCTLQYVWLSPK